MLLHLLYIVLRADGDLGPDFVLSGLEGDPEPELIVDSCLFGRLGVAGAGLGAVAFRYLIYFFTWLATGHVQFGQAGHAGSSHLPWLGLGFFVVIPPSAASSMAR